MRIFCSLTTIPSRFQRIEKTIDSLLDQTVLPDKIFIHIPETYNFRFKESHVNPQALELFRARYANYRDIVVFNPVKEDNGPGTKLVGFFETEQWGEQTADDFILIVDDDVLYNRDFVENYVQNIIKNGADAKKAYTFQKYHLNNLDERDKIYVGMCVAGFCLNCRFLNDFLDFFGKMRNHDFVLYHDELYISYYVKLMGIEIVDISEGRGLFYKTVENTHIDALNKVRGKYDRDVITPKIMRVFHTYYPHVLNDVVGAAAAEAAAAAPLPPPTTVKIINSSKIKKSIKMFF